MRSRVNTIDGPVRQSRCFHLNIDQVVLFSPPFIRDRTVALQIVRSMCLFDGHVRACMIIHGGMHAWCGEGRGADTVRGPSHFGITRNRAIPVTVPIRRLHE